MIHQVRLFPHLIRPFGQGMIQGNIILSPTILIIDHFFQYNFQTKKSLPIILCMEAALRDHNRQPVPEKLGPIYSRNFLNYLNQHTHMNITCFGLNCASPEDLIASLKGLFSHTSLVKEKRKKISVLFKKNPHISIPITF